jgi:hypothetical protein
VVLINFFRQEKVKSEERYCSRKILRIFLSPANAGLFAELSALIQL